MSIKLEVPSPGSAWLDQESSSVDFSAFYEREVDGQVRRAYLLLGSSEAAHDAVHDAFVAVYERWDSLNEPGPYLERTVLNRCRDVGRRRAVVRRHRRRFEAETVEYEVPLHDALSVLPFNHRTAVVMRYYLLMSEQEIADQLGCRPGSVGPWIQRGLRRLRKELS